MAIKRGSLAALYNSLDGLVDRSIMDRDAAVNLHRRKDSIARAALVEGHKEESAALKDKVQESLRDTDRMVTCAANFMREFHNRTQTATTASDVLVHSGIAQGLLDNNYQEERTRGCLVPLPEIVRTIRKEEHNRGGWVNSSG